MKRANETLVGATVLGALALVVAGSIWLSQARFGRDDQVAEARFRSIGGLQAGNPVLVHGVRIGRVEAIHLGDRNWVNVTFRIRGNAGLPPQPAAIISSTTLFGDWAAEIVPQAELPDDPEVRKQVAEGVAAGRDRWPGATLPAIGELTAQAGRIAGDIATIAGRVEAAFARIIRNTDSILGRVQAGEGTLGRLTRDTLLYTESVQAVTTLRTLLQDMQHNPRKYFSFSVF